MKPPVQYNSRFNTGMRWYWPTAVGILAGALVGLGTTVAGWTDPALQTLTHNAGLTSILSGIIGTAAGNGTIDFFNRYLARPTSTVDQAYQQALIWPQKDGYLIIQPHHHKSWRGWRDVINWQAAPHILGFTRTLDEAQAVCRNTTHDAGVLFDATHAAPRVQRALDRALTEYHQHPETYAALTANALTDIWHLTHVPGSPPGLVAYRHVLTADGSRIAFYPPPPATMTTVEALIRTMQQHDLLTDNDHQLPQMLPPGPELTRMPEIDRAWTIQGAARVAQEPWTLVPVFRHPDHPPTWIAACRIPTDHGSRWLFYPDPPASSPHPDGLRHDLQQAAAPGESLPVPFVRDVTRMTQIQAAWEAAQPHPPSPAPAVSGPRHRTAPRL
ncbi:hypothetical protein [Sulfobacillus thermosulfidooxidans]|uniref:hypothetical protein n=1 Tax=Sulfobacillus thermosulfidooxidans TaxID=28034 RepID=UPI0006B67C87|nr:hypothetical protein [Sulfobacillus thermosulfidooxidans]